MLKAERHNYIMTKLAEEHRVNTIQLAVELEVSEDSIRRDLNKLHEKGLLEKVYGGGIPVAEKNKSVFDILITNEDKKKEKRSFRYADRCAENKAAEEKTVP